MMKVGQRIMENWSFPPHRAPYLSPPVGQRAWDRLIRWLPIAGIVLPVIVDLGGTFGPPRWRL